MSYVLHVYRMTYKTYDIQKCIFVHPEEWYSMSSFFGIYLFHSLDIEKNEPFLGGFAPPATWRTTAVFSMVLDLFFPKHCVHKDTAMVLDLFFPKHCVHKDTARYVLSYSKPFELLSKINVDFLPKSENQATCVSFLSLNTHKSVIFLPITSEIHFCVKVFCHKLHTFASEKNKNRKI